MISTLITQVVLWEPPVRTKVKNIAIIRRRENQGFDNAAMTGYQVAIDDNMKTIIKVDSIGQLDLALRPEFSTPLLKALMRLNCLFKDFSGNAWLHFTIALFFICFMASVIIPPFQSPDEFDHIKRAYLLTKGQIVLDTPSGKSSGGLIDSGLSDYINIYSKFPYKSDRKLSLDEIDDANNIQWAHVTEFSPAPGTGYYFPLIYAPQATGLLIGEVFNLSVDQSYRLARFIVLLTAVQVIFFAFRLYRPPILVVALLVLPMSIFQLSSASLDGISTALVIFSVSVFLRMSIEKENFSPWLLYALTACVTIIVSSRVHLLPLILLIFASFFYTKNKKSLIAGGASLVFVTVWLAVAIKSTVDMRVVKDLSTSKVLAFYLFNPLSFFEILIATLSEADHLKFYKESFVGILGWLDARFNETVYISFYGLLLLIAFFSISFKNIRDRWPTSLLLLVCAFASLLLIFFALLVTWTEHPASLIHGVQGRYFLVPFLLFAYALNSNSRLVPQPFYFIGVTLVLVFFLFSTFTTTNLLLSRYYLAIEQPIQIKVEMRASAPLTQDQPIKIMMTEKQKANPSSLRSIGIRFGTHMRKNPGSAVLRLTTKGGENIVIPFELSNLIDNQYKIFTLDNRPYVTGEIFFSTGGGISVWEAHEATGSVSSCLVYELGNGAKRNTRGCPHL